MQPSIRDYYDHANESVRNEVENTSDDQVMGRDPAAWVEYLTKKWGMEEIAVDWERPRLTEAEHEYVTRGYDFYTDRAAGTRVRESAIRIDIPVVPTDTLKVIAQQKLAPNSRSISYTYPPFEYNEHAGSLSALAQPNKEDITRTIEKIRADVERYNTSIGEGEPRLADAIKELVRSKRERVAQKHKGLDDLAAAVGISITRKADLATVVPTAPKVRQKIAPILPPKSTPPTRPVLDSKSFEAILELVDRHCRQFERTPHAYLQLTEEGLRDTVLGSLNAVFEGAAVGEAFQLVGKVDIHLAIADGEVFVAELKTWSGPESLTEVISQLRGRLTWRDSFGVALVLSKNVGFTDVLKSIQEALSKLEGFMAGSLKKIAENHFQARFSLPGDGARQATIHVLAYNMYAATPAKRVVKQT